MSIPNDPVILLSYINTKLRDEFPSLEELCKTLGVDQAELEKKLAAIGYCYNEETNCFK
ncbi:DUF4250 domain-containing protein [Ruminococcus sp. XPD3002]|uniref:DUF4250 domain-containing protein n=1 Tax=Ruminococcus sp. XPD3002 TaxID=1452269 RepID=UPI000916520C|nr:protein of unknown function [Ruminococcus flavefaciens]HPY84972.1 DUF4250 domain-containing protein [Ruminococcus flavefaciens]HRU99367.1 DUF4250 domain-containing protein [Ruminococcus sp.]